jgi:hypothetical protein
MHAQQCAHKERVPVVRLLGSGRLEHVRARRLRELVVRTGAWCVGGVRDGRHVRAVCRQRSVLVLRQRQLQLALRVCAR